MLTTTERGQVPLSVVIFQGGMSPFGFDIGGG